MQIFNPVLHKTWADAALIAIGSSLNTLLVMQNVVEIVC